MFDYFLQVFEYERRPRLTWTDYISQVGGLLGLGLGFSFVSGIEIAFWLGFKLTRRIVPK